MDRLICRRHRAGEFGVDAQPFEQKRQDGRRVASECLVLDELGGRGAQLRELRAVELVALETKSLERSFLDMQLRLCQERGGSVRCCLRMGSKMRMRV